MARAAEALVTPAVLVWARDTLGLSTAEAARRLKVKADTLAAWEQGEKRPTVNQLRKIADTYRRPLAVFFLPKVPKDFQVAIKDFRRLPGDEPQTSSMPLRLAIRKAVERREVALELAKALNVEIPAFSLAGELTERPEEVADRIRAALGVTIDQQRAWETHYEALNSWRRAVERLGVLVFHADRVPMKDARGFGISERPLPVIVLNAKETPLGRVFTLLHELTHLLLREGGLCDLHEEPGRKGGSDAEVFCNHVAGAVIAPAAVVRAEPLVERHQKRADWELQDIDSLARRFWISREAMLRRLSVLGVASQAQYERYRAGLSTASRPAAKGFLAPPVKSLRNFGFLFTRLAVGAYHDELISGSDLSDHLELKLKHLPKIEDALAKGATADEVGA